MSGCLDGEDKGGTEKKDDKIFCNHESNYILSYFPYYEIFISNNQTVSLFQVKNMLSP
jgi:hypothetical protein